MQWLRAASRRSRCPRAAREARRASAPHHVRQPPRRAGRCVCGVSRAPRRMGASSFPTRSRAAHPRCCGRRVRSSGTRRGRRRISASITCRRGSATSRTSSTAALRANCGWPASRAPTARRRARNGSRRRSTCAGGAPRSSERSATGWSARSRRRRTRRPTSRVFHELLAQFHAAGAHGGRDGGVVARTRPGPRQRRDVRRRAVHEPHARPSRLSQDDGRLRQRQGEALLVAGPAHGGDQRRRRVRPEPRRRGAQARPAHADVRLRRRGHRGDARLARHVAASCSTSPRRGGARRCARRSWARSTRRTCSACWACCSRPTCRSTDAVAALARICAAGRPHAAHRRRRQAARRRRLRAHARRAREGAASRCVPRCRTAASSSACSDAAATATRASGRRWAAIAAAHADRIVVTSDNPRSEDPAEIANAIVRGVRDAGHRRWSIEVDRHAAIAQAIASAKARRHRADRRQGPRDLPGAARQAHAVLRRARSGCRARALERRMMDTATAARVVAGRAVGANVPLHARDDRQPQAACRAISSWRSRASASTATTSWPPRCRKARRRRWSPTTRVDVAPRGALIAVPDPLAALGRLASHWRAQFDIPLAIVVGSNGKTTVKEMTASILRAHYGAAAVLATEGNLNNAIGLPLTLLRLSDRARAAVVELGMNHRGETRELAAIAQPTIARRQQRAARAPGVHGQRRRGRRRARRRGACAAAGRRRGAERGRRACRDMARGARAAWARA